MKKIINSEKAPKAIGPYSHAVEANGFLFISGQLGFDPESNILKSGINDQTIQVMENIKNILTTGGYTFSDVVKTTILLADIADFKVVNEIYSRYYTNDFPARATYQVAGLPAGALVEIETIATKP